jgi:SOS-response transcriptional repressor LexA
MTTLLTKDSMPKPRWAEALAELRLAAGYRSQGSLAIQLGVSREKYAVLEAGHKEILKYLSYEERVKLLQLFKVDEETFVQRTGVPIFTAGTRPPVPIVADAYPVGYTRQRLHGIANGGHPIDTSEHLEVIIPASKKVRPGSQLYGVAGDSMVDPADPDAAWNLHDGDMVYVDPTQKSPTHGCVYVIKLDGLGYMVKKLENIAGDWFLRAYNETVFKSRRVSWDETEVMGLVYLRIPNVMEFRPKR